MVFCKDCIFFLEDVKTMENGICEGHCKRYPPVKDFSWNKVWSNQGCGEGRKNLKTDRSKAKNS